MRSRIAVLIAGALLCVAGLSASALAAPLQLAGRTELPGYTGDFDHFEYDIKENRLWLAAEDHGTLDVFDLRTGKLRKSVEGVVSTPHTIEHVRATDRLVVSDSGGDGQPRVIDAATDKLIGAIKLAAPASDAMEYDPASERLYVVSGGRDAKMQKVLLTAIDALTLKRVGEVTFDTDKVEAMQIEQNGSRLYVNVTGRNELVVLDKATLQRLATWPIKEAEQNAPMALDELGRRLFVITRKPSKLIVLNADTGASVASFKAPERCDQVIWDAANRRVYALGGDGYIGVFQQKDADHYEELARVPSAPGAKTGVLVPQLSRLYVAVSPGEATTGAAILRFDVAPAAH